MADYKVTDTQLSSIANAIRTKGGTSDPLVFPAGFVSAVENISTSGVLISKNISQNGTYNPSDDNADAYSQVVVDVSSGGGGEIPDFVLDGSQGDLVLSGLTSLRPFGLYQHLSISTVSLDNVLSIGSYAFAYCQRLSKAYFEKCLTVGSSAFNGCVGLNEVSLPSCQTIMQQAFVSCNYLANINISNCITIRDYAFSGCNRLTQAIIPKCTTIGSRAFRSCYALSQVHAESCKRIESMAFGDCSKFESMYISTSDCVLANTDAFTNTAMTNPALLGGRYASIYVPSEYVDTYKSAAQWSYYSDRITSYVEE